MARGQCQLLSAGPSAAPCPRLQCRAGDGEEHTEMDLLTWSEGTREGNRNDYSKKDIKRKYSGKSPSGSSEASS